MELAIELARRNVDHGGGPFGATIVDSASGAVVAVGANWVVSQQSSLLHAEIGAIAFAQAALGSHTLAGEMVDLVTSSEPCAQCLGATVWSGVRHLVCGAAASDAEAIGFDEGPMRGRLGGGARAARDPRDARRPRSKSTRGPRGLQGSRRPHLQRPRPAIGAVDERVAPCGA